MKEKKLKSLKNNLLGNIWLCKYMNWLLYYMDPCHEKVNTCLEKIINLWPEAATGVVL